MKPSTNLGGAQGVVPFLSRVRDLVQQCSVQTLEGIHQMDRRCSDEHTTFMSYELQARIHQPVEEIVDKLSVFIRQGVRKVVLHVRGFERLPAELLRLKVDHPAATDSGGRRLLQVSRLKYQVHLIAHLNDLTAHQAQLKGGEKGKMQ